ncbi:MAG: dienelactone hydrolase family protein [Anaerolineaceae bacterium]|nr:dienelactone hydrolase family protein [Anaerolineaceae bacterium]
MTSPHSSTPVMETGLPVAEAQAALVLIHGRGAGPQGMMPLLAHLNVPGYTYLLPAASGNTWYPNRFIVPREQNQPYLDAALGKIDSVVSHLIEQGIPTEKIVLLGFSQGACLATEYAARNPARYGGVVALSGGLIGAEGELTGYEGDLQGTPIYLGCDAEDVHIPQQRVHDSADILSNLGGQVKKQIFNGLGHSVNEVELAIARSMMTRVTE